MVRRVEIFHLLRGTVAISYAGRDSLSGSAESPIILQVGAEDRLPQVPRRVGSKGEQRKLFRLSSEIRQGSEREGPGTCEATTSFNVVQPLCRVL